MGFFVTPLAFFVVFQAQLCFFVLMDVRCGRGVADCACCSFYTQRSWNLGGFSLIVGGVPSLPPVFRLFRTITTALHVISHDDDTHTCTYAICDPFCFSLDGFVGDCFEPRKQVGDCFKTRKNKFQGVPYSASPQSSPRYTDVYRDTNCIVCCHGHGQRLIG